ncbi:MAG: hypothetical protein M3R45_10200 [Pseudomonadota bacterium]|nr:hypothetical protein [Pseudomonadota bacterium]
MKRFISACLLASLAGLSNAQTVVPEVPQPDSLTAQRTRISAQRARLEAGFAAEDAACYSRFAVNNCLDKINTQRRQAMAELRRQEILLNDEERKNRGQEQLRSIQEKSSPENLEKAAQRRVKAAEDYQSRLEQEKTQQQQRAAALSGEQAARDTHAQKQVEHQKKAQSLAAKQAKAAEESKKFNARQKEAAARQVKHEADQLKRAHSPAKPLPLPELPR